VYRSGNLAPDARKNLSERPQENSAYRYSNDFIRKDEQPRRTRVIA
jgi:hypothetical protein